MKESDIRHLRKETSERRKGTRREKTWINKDLQLTSINGGYRSNKHNPHRRNRNIWWLISILTLIFKMLNKINTVPHHSKNKHTVKASVMVASNVLCLPMCNI